MVILFAKAVGVWVLFAILGVLNGVLREYLLVPGLGKRLSLPLSGVLLSAAVLLVTVLLFPFLGLKDTVECFLVGGFWLVATVAFEFLFGHFVAGKPWSELAQAYNILSGNLWPLVLVMIALSPYLAGRIRGAI
jgi:hypothetical protein